MVRPIKASLGISNGKVSEYHSRRTYTPSSAEPSLADRNVHIYDPRHADGSLVTYKEQFNATFADSIERYNAKQKRARLRKDEDYYEEISTGKRKEKPVYSTLLQLGNRLTYGVTDATFDRKTWEQLKSSDPDAAAAYVQKHLNKSRDRERVKACLVDICEQFQGWYPNLKVVSIVIHDDEPDGTPHADINWIPVAGGEDSGVYKGGLDTRCALNRALKQMGYNGRGYDFAIKHWQADFKTRCEGVMAEYDIEREYMNNDEKHKDIATYRLEQEQKEAAEKTAELQRKAELKRETIARYEDEIRIVKRRKDDIEEETMQAEKRLRETEERRRKAEDEARKLEQEWDDAEARVRAARADEHYARKRAQQIADEAERVARETEKSRRILDQIADEVEKKRRYLCELIDGIDYLTDIENAVSVHFDYTMKWLNKVADDKDMPLQVSMNARRAVNVLEGLKDDYVADAAGYLANLFANAGKVVKGFVEPKQKEKTWLERAAEAVVNGFDR